MTCSACRDDDCGDCVDKAMLAIGRDRICACERKLHLEKVKGEAYLKQVRDPVTGDVHAPGLIVTNDGEVIFRGDCTSGD